MKDLIKPKSPIGVVAGLFFMIANTSVNSSIGKTLGFTLIGAILGTISENVITNAIRKDYLAEQKEETPTT